MRDLIELTLETEGYEPVIGPISGSDLLLQRQEQKVLLVTEHWRDPVLEPAQLERAVFGGFLFKYRPAHRMGLAVERHALSLLFFRRPPNSIKTEEKSFSFEGIALVLTGTPTERVEH